jgi:putative queuosine salvage protein
VSLTDDVRAACREIAASARHVRIDRERLDAIDPGSPPALDAERHYLEGPPEDVADYMLVLDSINFGSGWFPTLRKRPGMSGYFTVAASLADHWRSSGGWSVDELRALTPSDVALVLGQDADHELMGLYVEAIRDLGRFLGARRALDLVAEAGGSAERLASMLAAGMPFFDDVGFWKRAQIVPNDLALAGVAEFGDLDRLTIFADNLVPHVLRVDGVLVYDPALAARIDAGELLPPGSEEREIRGCAVHACELIAARLAVPARVVDVALWNRGQAPRYKSVPRHRTRTVFY